MKFIHLVLFSMLAFVTVETHAQDTTPARSVWAPHVGFLAGVAKPEGDYKSSGEIGLDLGYQHDVPFSSGLEVTYFNSSGDNDDLERTQLMIRGAYNFGGETFLINRSYIGLAVGGTYNGHETKLVSAPILGFDIPLSDATEDFITLGLNARYAITEGSLPDAASVLGALKYWF